MDLEARREGGGDGGDLGAAGGRAWPGDERGVVQDDGDVLDEAAVGAGLVGFEGDELDAEAGQGRGVGGLLGARAGRVERRVGRGGGERVDE